MSAKGAEGGAFHAVADEGAPFKEIAEMIGRRWKPEQPGLIADIDHLAYFAQQRWGRHEMAAGDARPARSPSGSINQGPRF